MTKFIILLFLLSSVSVHAQTIRGTVCMEKDKTPAQFASVGLAQLPDSTILTGVITLTDGGYLFEKVKPGNYYILVSFLGYTTQGTNAAVGEGSGEIQVDTIFLAETATNLEEVTVVGERLKGKELVDRTTYAIPAVVAKTAHNGYELLKRIPQVNVDFQNNVTLNGSNNFIIQVDGRQRDKEFLAKLLPSDIETIEIISNPSGRYEGNIDGVINIILKKEARYGINGNVGINIKPLNKLTTTASASLDYALGKITFYVTAFTFSQNLHISSTNDYQFKMIDSTSNMAGNGGINVTSSSINTGFDYYMNDKNNLSFNISYRPIHQQIDMFSEAYLSKNNNPENTLISLTDNGLNSDETAISLFYKKTFKKAVQEFSAEASYYLFDSKEGNAFTNTRFLYNTDTLINTLTRIEDNLNERNYFSVKLNYVHPIGLSAKVETGYQGYYQKMGYDFNIDNLESSNLFKYNEFRNSVYGGITYNLKKFGFQGVLRIENSNIKADSVTSPDYYCLLPSVNIQYKFSASHNLKFTYNRRINRPGIYDMNPYWRIGQNYDISQGNPDLKPDYRDRMQLTYTWNFGSNYFSPNIYYEFLSDKVGRQYTGTLSPIDSSFTTFSKPFNLLSGYEYGGGVNAMLWFVNINARIFKGHFDAYMGQSFTIPARDYYSFSITGQAFKSFGKDKKTTAFAFISYNGVNVDAQTKTYSIPFYGVGMQKQIKDHSLGFVYLLPLSGDVKLSRSETETPFYNINTVIGFDVSYYIMLMYSYKFNKGKSVKKLDHKIDVESDSKSQGIGS
ncbi:MAG TPA: TonB-dependent receptor [Bacteroidales bacterium]|nr:TonB-dependent receptor [Bacteroidales bacterium]